MLACSDPYVTWPFVVMILGLALIAGFILIAYLIGDDN